MVFPRTIPIGLKVFLSLLSLLVLMVGLLGGGLFLLVFRLSQGPLTLQNYVSSLDYALHRYLPHSHLTADRLILRWDSKRTHFVLEGTQVTVRSLKSRSAYSVEKISLKWHLLKVLSFSFMPHEVVLQAPSLKVKGNQEDQKDFSLLTQDNTEREDVVKFLQTVMHQRTFKKLIILNARFSFQSPLSGIKWKIPKANLILKSSQKGTEGVFQVSVQEGGDMVGIFKGQEHGQSVFQVAFKAFKPQAILASLPSNDNKTGASDSAKESFSFNAPVSGLVTLKLKPDLDLESLSFFIGCGEGTLEIPHLLPQKLPLRTGSLKGIFTQGLLTLAEANLQTALFKLQCQGTMKPLPHFQDVKTLSFDLKTQVQDFQFQKAPLLWKENLAPSVRDWILKNIPQGGCRALVEVQGTYSLEKKPWEKTQQKNENSKNPLNLQKLQGRLWPEKASLFYLEGLPPIEEMDAEISFDQKTMTIDVKKGHTFSQRIGSGLVVIQNLDQEDQTIQIDLDLEGSVKDALKIINVKRLRYADHYGLPLNQVQGIALSKLHFSFPLSLTTSIDVVNFSVESKLKKLKIPHVLKTPPLTLSQGELFLTLNKDGMALKGTGLLNGAVAQISLQESFKAQKNPKSQWEVSGVFSENQWKTMGWPLEPYISGKIPLRVNATKGGTDQTHLSLHADFRDATLVVPAFRIYAEKSKNHTLTVDLDLKKGRPQRIKKLKISAGSALQVDAEATFSSQTGALQEVILNRFLTASDHYEGRVTLDSRGVYQVTLGGSYIDLQSFLEHRKDLEDSFLDQVAYEGHLNFQKAYLKGAPLFHSVKGRVHQSSQGIITFLTLNAQLDSSSKSSKPQNCKVNLTTQGGTQSLVVDFDDVGTILKALTNNTDLRGGETRLEAKRTLTTSKPLSWEGSYNIHGFQIVKAPMLARLLKIASPFAFVELFNRGTGLEFSELKGRFCLKPDVLILRKGIATGPSLGMTLGGVIDRKNKTLNLRGTIIPAYMLNAFFSYIPILGKLLAGGKGEGIFSVGFSIQGPQSDPQISSNPLSVLTPGFLKKLFEVEAPEVSIPPQKDSGRPSSRKETFSRARPRQN